MSVLNSKTPDVFSASTIEMVCRELAEALTGGQIRNLITPLRTPPGDDDDRNTKWKRLFNAVVAAQNRQRDGRPLIRLTTDVMQPVRFSSTTEFKARRAAVNERLLLSGFQVRNDGRVGVVRAATTLAESQQRADSLHAELTRREVHEDVLQFCRSELLEQNYFHAVLEASKSVAEKLRSRTGVQGDGAALVDAVCSISSGPLLAFNDLSNEWETSEQKGLAMLLKGLFGTFRNPAAHAPKVLWATSRAEALDMMTLASMMHRRIDDARAADRL